MEEALYLPEVLEVIMENLDKNSLLECRKVCKKWNTEAIKILDDKFYAEPYYCTGYIDGVSIKFQKFRFGIALNCWTNCWYASLEEFENFIASIKYPFKSLSLNIRTLVNTRIPSKQLLDTIFSLLPKLECLDVHIFVVATKGWRTQVSNCQEETSCYSGGTLPQLESMSICVSYQNLFPAGHLQDINFIIKNLVAGAVNVKSFILSNCSDYTAGCAQAISSISSPSLQKVIIAGEWTTPENVSCLYNHTIPFPLTTLDLCIDMSTIGAAEMEKLLSTYSATLETLKIWFENEDRFDKAYLHFPLGVHMIKLRNLKLEIGKPVRFDWSHLPQLKRLQFERSSFKRLKSSVMAHSGQFPLESLELVWLIESPEVLLTMFAEVKVLLFSRLASLKLYHCDNHHHGITPQLLQFIFKECRELKELDTVLNDNVNDSIFCGVAESKNVQLSVTWPDENIRNEDRNMDETISRGFRRLVAQARNSDLGMWRALPWIGDLKHLQSLALFGADMLSELSLLHGILHCSALKKLEISSDKMNVQRVTHIIRQADLIHLTSAKFNHNYINHLP